ncbi:hypothetical protein [Bacillus sp. MUM 13]|uniref:hypothetical protein n=1 Tax=Bacillus sp. MUM 13 TaxID=1678001 RepID=UPI001114151B|nr:hypothetical protein [Bacillus sp. MUM 13]
MSIKRDQLNISCVNIISMDQSSSVSVGSTVKIGRYVSAKKNQSFGQQGGFGCMLTHFKGILSDSDMLDAAAEKFTP